MAAMATNVHALAIKQRKMTIDARPICGCMVLTSTARRLPRPVCAAGDDGPSTSATSSGASTRPPSDPVGAVAWGGRLPSRRRLIIGLSLASFVALGGNLGGVTSALLSLDGGRVAAATGLDMVVPVKGFKRCRDTGNGFEFLYPARWLADQTIARRNAERMEQALDPPSLRDARRRRRTYTEPTAAFGPMGGTGEENVSVVVAPIMPGFSIRSLGEPEEAAGRILGAFVAPEGSGKRAELRAAGRLGGGDLPDDYVWLEYVVLTDKWQRHNVSVVAARDGILSTMNAQCAEADWPRDGDLLRQCALSFRLLPGTSGAAFPTAL